MLRTHKFSSTGFPKYSCPFLLYWPATACVLCPYQDSAIYCDPARHAPPPATHTERAGHANTPVVWKQSRCEVCVWETIWRERFYCVTCILVNWRHQHFKNMDFIILKVICFQFWVKNLKYWSIKICSRIHYREQSFKFQNNRSKIKYSLNFQHIFTLLLI